MRTYFQRIHRVYLAVAVVPCVLVLVGRNQRTPLAVVCFAIAAICAWGMCAVYFFRLLVARRRVARFDFEVCLYCHYPLRGLPPDGRCPECGQPYVKNDVVNEWKRLPGGE
ncbi:MAG: hypothetical protein JXA69_04730 [Phycisphaerae bacterium]|nr:hypothetical protein [Phycisphaerae bacterium]